MEESKAANAAQAERVVALTAQLEALQAEVQQAKDNLAALRASSDDASTSASAAAAVEHAALLKAQADYEAIKAESDALKAAQSEALAAAEAKIKELEEKASSADVLASELASQVDQLKLENEEKANKVSELEVEILELKEEQENSGDEHSKTLARLKSLEEELTASAAAVQKALEDAQAKAELMSHVGFLTLPDRTSFPRIVGSKGANIARMHGETGADITVSRDDTTIVIMGTETAIEEAKETILRIVNDSSTGAPRGERRGGRGRGRGRRDDDY